MTATPQSGGLTDILGSPLLLAALAFTKRPYERV
jgi:hypothetical protein